MTKREKILVPLSVPEGTELCGALRDLVKEQEIIALGYCLVPKQTDTEQARDKFKAESQEELESLAASFGDASSIRTRLVFTHDRNRTIGRVADEEECSIVLLPKPVEECRRILVLIREAGHADRAMSALRALSPSGSRKVTILHGVEDEERAGEHHDLLEDAGRRMIEDSGRDLEIEVKVVVTGDLRGKVEKEAKEHDLLLLVEEKESWTDLISGGMVSVTEKTGSPMLIVRGA